MCIFDAHKKERRANDTIWHDWGVIKYDSYSLVLHINEFLLMSNALKALTSR